jgi:hypothetical protein
MIRLSARSFFLIGLLLVFLGFFLPLLMVLKILESTFFLNFFSFLASVFGLFFGLMSAAQFAVQIRRKRGK